MPQSSETHSAFGEACPGCGHPFASKRGLRAHQNRPNAQPSCRPEKPKVSPVAERLANGLTIAVVMGDYIPAHDESFDAAEGVAALLAAFHAHVVQTRSPEQANNALVEFGNAIAVATTTVAKGA